MAVRRTVVRHAPVAAITLLALGIRLWWNLKIHPPHEHVFSDMGGYFDRAQDFVRQGLTEKHDYLAFYPWGAHVFLGLVKRFFGTAPCTRQALGGCGPMDVSLAVTGALAVTYTTLLARRLARTREAAASGRRRWLFHVVVGLFAAVYYPFIAQGGYFLSEGPFTLCLAAVAFHSLRAVDEGKRVDFFWTGLWAGLGAIVRPQMLMSVALLGLFGLWRYRHRPFVTIRKIAWGAVPLALVLAFSAVRTTRHYREFEKNGFALVSTNDTLNYAFGRCHSIGIEARTKGYSAGFGPPSLGALYFGMEQFKKKHGWAPLELKPAMPFDGRCGVNQQHASKREPAEPCIMFEGTMWSRQTLRDIAYRCTRKTGLLRQAYYAATHVVLNFGLNELWPNTGPREWRGTGERWQIGFGVTVMPFALLACFLGFRRRLKRQGLLAVHVWAVTVVALLYFGEVRLRTPYDVILIPLGFDLLARTGRWLRTRLAGLAGGLAAPFQGR